MLRLLIYGVCGSPIYEVSQRLSSFYDIEMMVIENTPVENRDYFSDNIPEVTFDTGDFSSGSEQNQHYRDPSSMDYDKIIDKITSIIDVSQESIPSDELGLIFKMRQGIVVTEIPDVNLIRWATHILYFYSKESSAVSWFSKRLKCPSCGNVHHLEDKPPRNVNICDRCGTDLIRLESDNPKHVKLQYKNWENYFWKMREYSKDHGNYRIINVDKFDTLESIISNVNLLVRSSIEHNDWYKLLQDRDGLKLSPLDGPFIWNPQSGKLEKR